MPLKSELVSLPTWAREQKIEEIPPGIEASWVAAAFMDLKEYSAHQTTPTGEGGGKSSKS